MSLYKKMHAVMCESEAISKEMTVGFGQNAYKAVSEASVLNEIKPLLKKHGLVIFPVAMEVVDRYDIFTTAKGESSRLMTQVKAKYKIVDVDTGESEILETVGNGVDTQDKASGKAITYGYKALIQKTFCLFSGEDSDNEHSDNVTDKQTKKSPVKQSPSQPDKPPTTTPQLITPNQAADVVALASEVNVPMATVLTTYKLAKLDDMTIDLYNRCIASLTKKKSLRV
jgi:hypothetical protein